MKKSRRTRVEWKSDVSEWMESGETAVVFAATRGLNVNSLRWWKSELFGVRRSAGTTTARVKGTNGRKDPSPALSAFPLTVRLADELAQESSLATHVLVARLGASYRAVLRELRELEELGIVTRTGKGPGAAWALG